ncbi:MAG: hypothetical protein JRF55_01425 [Deltaproteobacteria bacterium]|nr:hypothetical protein [Deltaproteobacteria bacterium]
MGEPGRGHTDPGFVIGDDPVVDPIALDLEGNDLRLLSRPPRSLGRLRDDIVVGLAVLGHDEMDFRLIDPDRLDLNRVVHDEGNEVYACCHRLRCEERDPFEFTFTSDLQRADLRGEGRKGREQ